MAIVIRNNSNTFESGEEYFNRLSSEAERSFHILLSLLSSYWQATVDGPNYARELKAMAIEMSRLRLMLEDIQQDTDFSTTRTEFLHQVVTSMLFPKETGAPNTGQSDEDFRQFLLQIIKIYFAGSIPASVESAVRLVTGSQVTIRENFLEARKPGTGFDISDQFGFSVDVVLNSPSQFDVFTADKNIHILLALIRPTHTLYQIRHILQDSYEGTLPTPLNPASNTQTNKIGDVDSWILSDYGYEDFRRFVGGVSGVDPRGAKKPIPIVGEDHSQQFGV